MYSARARDILGWTNRKAGVLCVIYGACWHADRLRYFIGLSQGIFTSRTGPYNSPGWVGHVQLINQSVQSLSSAVCRPHMHKWQRFPVDLFNQKLDRLQRTRKLLKTAALSPGMSNNSIMCGLLFLIYDHVYCALRHLLQWRKLTLHLYNIFCLNFGWRTDVLFINSNMDMK
jgi:hypothetical protein